MDIIIKQIEKGFLSENVNQFIEIISFFKEEYWREEHFLKELPGKFEYSWIALIHGKIIGFIIASIKEGKKIHIHKLFVHESFQNIKTGSKLISCLEEKAKINDIEFITLYVDEQNLLAKRFYTKHGFIIEDRKIDSVLKREQCYMIKKIK